MAAFDEVDDLWNFGLMAQEDIRHGHRFSVGDAAIGRVRTRFDASADNANLMVVEEAAKRAVKTLHGTYMAGKDVGLSTYEDMMTMKLGSRSFHFSRDIEGLNRHIDMLRDQGRDIEATQLELKFAYARAAYTDNYHNASAYPGFDQVQQDARASAIQEMEVDRDNYVAKRRGKEVSGYTTPPPQAKRRRVGEGKEDEPVRLTEHDVSRANIRRVRAQRALKAHEEKQEGEKDLEDIKHKK